MRLKKRGAYKVVGGKLIRIAADFQGKRVKDIRITGDFFVYPESGLEAIEEVVRGKRPGEVREAVEKAAREQGITLFGLSAADLAEAIAQARGNSVSAKAGGGAE